MKLEETFNFPKDNHHITTLFLGGSHFDKLKPRQKDLFKNFVFGKKCVIQVDLLLYVPDYILVGYSPKLEHGL